MDVEEREAIALGLARDEPFAEIARRLGRPTSTVSREVVRCGGRASYSGRTAQRLACERARRPKVRKLVTFPSLAETVSVGLEKRWSPAKIAARLAVDHPDDEAMRVSHETIYSSLYLQGKGGLKQGWPEEGADWRLALGAASPSSPTAGRYGEACQCVG